jgi:hypothetical protein
LFPQITDCLVYKEEETVNNMNSTPGIKLAENIDGMKKPFGVHLMQHTKLDKISTYYCFTFLS